jgi:hypothetical protein
VGPSHQREEGVGCVPLRGEAVLGHGPDLELGWFGSPGLLLFFYFFFLFFILKSELFQIPLQIWFKPIQTNSSNLLIFTTVF